jgi:hypothetical protein
VTTLTHDYDGSVDLSPYHFDRYQPSWSPPYSPTLGYNPPANDRYCAIHEVPRDVTASFVARALGLLPMVPPPRN